MVTWLTPTKRYAQKVKLPAALISPETLAACRAGLSKRMRNAKDSNERDRIKDIRDEIDSLIELL